MTPSLTIRTPEGIEFALPLAGPISRMLALAVDLAAIAAFSSAAAKLLAPLQMFGQDIAQATQVVLSLIHI